MRHTLLPLFATLFSGTVFGQIGGYYSDPDSEATFLDWPSGAAYLPAGSFERAVLGHFADDGNLHGIVVRSGQAFFVYGPQVYAQITPTSLTGIDALDVLKDEGTSAPDAIVFATSAGLQRADFDLTNVIDQGDFTNFQTIATGDWQGAHLVRGVDVDGDGDCDVIGIDGSGTQLLMLTNLGNGSFGSPASIDPGVAILDFAIGDYDGQPADMEVAILTPQYVDFFSLSDLQTPIKRWAVPNGSLMTSFRTRAAASEDRVALVFQSGTASQWYLTSFDALTRDVAPLPLLFDSPEPNSAPTWIDPVSVVSVDDVDLADGAEHLYVTHTSFGTAVRIENTYAAADPSHFDGSYELIAFPNASSPMPGEAAVPGLVPLEHMGGVLGLFPLDSRDGLHLHRTPGVLPIQTGGFLGLNPDETRLVIGTTALGAPDTRPYDHDLRVSIVLPLELGDLTHVQAIVWSEDTPNEGISHNEANWVCPIENPQPGAYRYLQIPLEPLGYDPDVDPQLVFPAGLHYFIHLRLVETETIGGQTHVVETAGDAVLGVRVQSYDTECVPGGGSYVPCTAYMESLAPYVGPTADLYDFEIETVVIGPPGATTYHNIIYPGGAPIGGISGFGTIYAMTQGLNRAPIDDGPQVTVNPQ